MRINPTISSGIVLMHEDGSFEMAPFQVFSTANGGVQIRIGRNMLFFDPDGEFDGSECKGDAKCDAEALVNAFVIQGENKNKAPSTAYFREGTPGHQDETLFWPGHKGRLQ